MKKFKDFFDKKQSELKFKKAGTGYKLSGSSNASNSAPSTSNVALPQRQRADGPDRNVANAALARFENKNVPTNTLTNIMLQEKQKITQEIKLREELEEQRTKSSQLKVSSCLSEFDKNQKFLCPSLGINESFSFEDLLREIKMSIYDNFSEDPTLRSLMCLFNLNRAVGQSDTRLKNCLDIIEKIIKNLLTEDREQFEKFRRIRKSKIEQKVLSLDGALDFLFAIGFSNDSTNEWLVYQGDEENIQGKMLYLIDLVEHPQIIPIELDRQLKYYSDEDLKVKDTDVDLKPTSSDIKKLYNNLERKREINEMFASKETKDNLLANRTTNQTTTNHFTRLRFKFALRTDENLENFEATFYSSETLNDVRTWLMTNFIQTFPDNRHIAFRNGPILLEEDKYSCSLTELKLTPAATLLVIAI